MEIKLKIKDKRVNDFLETCDLIIEQNKDKNYNAWALGIDLKRVAVKTLAKSVQND